jgi:ribosomal protein S25
VDADLEAIFDANPRAVAILDHCRGDGGLFVQAAIADRMERAPGKYHFRLFGDLSSGMATSNLGIVYPEEVSAEVRRCLAELAHLFSERLDPLWLASREQELIGLVSTCRDEADTLSRQHQDLMAEYQALAGRNTELQKRISQLEKRKSKLQERNAGLKMEKKGLQSRTSQLAQRIFQLEKRTSRLQERNSRLKEQRLLVVSKLSDYRGAGRYKLADAVAKNVLRIPGAKAVARRTRPKE